jgi:hypothetical protein
MRKILILLIVVSIVASCNSKVSFNATVNYETVKVEKTGFDSTYDVSVEYYSPVDAPVYLKDSILKNIKLLLASWFDVKGEFNLETSVKKHFDDYSRQFTENSLPAHSAFILRISPAESYQNEHIVSFAYQWMIYEGGAHPNSGTMCFVINKNTGAKVSYQSLIAGHEAEFLSLAESEFRSQSGVKTNEEMYSTYSFKDNKFHLTDNYILTSEGIVFCYDPYEIAPYSFGHIKLALSYDKIKSLIKCPS